MISTCNVLHGNKTYTLSLSLSFIVKGWGRGVGGVMGVGGGDGWGWGRGWGNGWWLPIVVSCFVFYCNRV